MFSLRPRLEKVRELTKSLGLILCGSGTCVQNDIAIQDLLRNMGGQRMYITISAVTAFPNKRKYSINLRRDGHFIILQYF